MVLSKIVKGNKDYVKEYIYLIKSTGESIYPFIFGKNLKKILYQLYLDKNNIFSHRYSHFVLINDTVTGLLQSYGGNIGLRPTLKTGYILLKNSFRKMIFNLNDFIKLINSFGPMRNTDYYIEALAVNSNYRKQGLGELLLSHAETIAKTNGFKRLVLEVESDNSSAISLYLKKNFKLYNNFIIYFNESKLNFKKMVKLLV